MMVLELGLSILNDYKYLSCDKNRVIFYGLLKLDDTFNIILTGVTALCSLARKLILAWY